MSILSLVTHQQLARQWRQSALHAHHDLLPFSIQEIVSHLLKEQGLPYRDSVLLEHITLLEAVWELQDELGYYQSMIDFPGFIDDLHTFFFNFSTAKIDLTQLSSAEQEDLNLILTRYKEKLNELNILDQAGQINHALQYWPNSKLYQDIDLVRLYYLGDLTPLEHKFVKEICAGKKVEHCHYSESKANVTAKVARTPSEEIEYVALEIIRLLNQGIEPQKIAVVSPNLSAYMSVILPLFSKYKLHWSKSGLTLADTPLGKAFLSVIRMLKSDWSKTDLENLVAPGWGLPFILSQEERKVLQLAPVNLRTRSKWKDALGEYPGWKNLFAFMESIQVKPGSYSVSSLNEKIENILTEFPLSTWPVRDHNQWAVLCQSFEGIKQIFTDLASSTQQLDLAKFEQLWQRATKTFVLPRPQDFIQNITVGSMLHAVGMDWHTVFVVGLTEASFPKPSRRDWLSKQILTSSDQELYQQLLLSTANIHLSYPQEDQSGKMNLVSPVFPDEVLKVEDEFVPSPSMSPSKLGDGILTDSNLIDDIIARYKTEPLSVSRLNLYATCPFRFLCSDLYRLEEDEVLSDEITPQEEGTLIHEALKQFWQKHAQVPILEILTSLFQDSGIHLTKRIIAMVTNFNKKDVALVESSGYYPTYLEQRFSNIPIGTSHGEIKLHGMIDRIDVNAAGNFVVYDYKTGTNPSVRNILDGNNLQLQVYLLAANSLYGNKAHGMAFYNVRGSQRTGLWLEDTYQKLGLTRRNSGITAANEWEGLVNDCHRVLQQYLELILSGHFPVQPVDDRVCTYCPYFAICRKEV